MSTLPVRYDNPGDCTTIHMITQADVESWIASLPDLHRQWLDATTPALLEPGGWSFMPGRGETGSGNDPEILVVTKAPESLVELAVLADALPEGNYRIANLPSTLTSQAVWHWTGGGYRYSRYREPKRKPAILCLDRTDALGEAMARARYLCRDLVNTPAGDLGPLEFAEAARQEMEPLGARVNVTHGDDLAKQYPLVHAVGRGASRPPLVIEIAHGAADLPEVCLVGKGIVFDSGGLDIKPSAGMRNMKKDMGGGAHALALSQLLIAAHVPVRLRCLIPVAENAVSGDAYRPGDVLRARNGKTVEIHNTDAEGRLVMADALTDAASNNPDLVVDFSTLTGAARVALGPDLPAMFCNDDAVAKELLEHGQHCGEPMWRLPLFAEYRSMLDSTIADISNASNSSYGGAITAALFLSEFVSDAPRWVHFDLFAWSDSAKPGIAAGGKDQCLRAVFEFLQARYPASRG